MKPCSKMSNQTKLILNDYRHAWSDFELTKMNLTISKSTPNMQS